MSYDLYPWQRKLISAISLLHQVQQDMPKFLSHLSPKDFYWTWEKIMDLQTLAKKIYHLGAEESRTRGKPEEVVSRVDW